jgi:heme oxygenase
VGLTPNFGTRGHFAAEGIAAAMHWASNVAQLNINRQVFHPQIVTV